MNRLHPAIFSACALIAASWLLLAAGPAAAAVPTPPTALPARHGPPEAWAGRTCTRARCLGSDASAWGHAAGFGAAVLLTGLVASRRSATAH